VSRGTSIPADRLEGPTNTLVVVGDRYFLMTHAGTLALDSAKNTIDFDVKNGRYNGTVLPSRYELKEDTLKIILPTSLLKPIRVPEPKPGENPEGIVLTLQRDGKATKQQAEAMLKDRTDALPDKAPAGFGGAIPFGGGKGVAKGGGFGGAMPAAATQQLLERILERLERIEQRWTPWKRAGCPAGAEVREEPRVYREILRELLLQERPRRLPIFVAARLFHLPPSQLSETVMFPTCPNATVMAFPSSP